MQLKLTEAQRQEALARAKKQPRRECNGYVCIGGIGPHSECYGHGPRIGPKGRETYCPYCITPTGQAAQEAPDATK